MHDEQEPKTDDSFAEELEALTIQLHELFRDLIGADAESLTALAEELGRLWGELTFLLQKQAFYAGFAASSSFQEEHKEIAFTQWCNAITMRKLERMAETVKNDQDEDDDDGYLN